MVVEGDRTNESVNNINQGDKIMKKLIVIFLVVVISGCATTSSLPPEGPSNTPMDKADTILLKVDQSPQEAYQNFAQYLSSKGFGFENTDESLKVFKTSMRSMNEINAQYSLDVSIMESNSSSVIRITGTGSSNTLGKFEIVKGGDSSASGLPGVSIAPQAWNKMKQIATSYPKTTDVSYQRN